MQVGRKKGKKGKERERERDGKDEEVLANVRGRRKGLKRARKKEENEATWKEGRERGGERMRGERARRDDIAREKKSERRI